MIRQAMIRRDAWAPLPLEGPSGLGQPMPTPLATPPVTPPPAKPPAILDSKFVSVIGDGLGVAAFWTLASIYGSAKMRQDAPATARWATAFWVGAAVLGFKGVLDLSYARQGLNVSGR